jgi:hypothetical protein
MRFGTYRPSRFVRSFNCSRVASLAILLTLSGAAGARQQTLPPIDAAPANSKDPFPAGKDEDPGARTRQDNQVRALANDRQKRLIADTERLVELSNELKVEVSKSTKNDLSVTVVRKAGEIEKLARDVKERERN